MCGDVAFVNECYGCRKVVCIVEGLGMSFIYLGRSVRFKFGSVNLLEVICGF